MKGRILSIGFAAMMTTGLVLFPLTGCGAQDLADPPEIGAEMPNFELTDLEGNTHTLEQYRDKIVVLEMTSRHCPWVRGADPDLIALAEKHAEDAVVFISIDSHSDTAKSAIKEYNDEIGKKMTALKDAGNAYADRVGARVTPEIYIVDKDGKLAYHGAFDNRTKPEEKGEEAYTAKAVQALLDGDTVEPTRVKAWGCSIKRK